MSREQDQSLSISNQNHENLLSNIFGQRLKTTHLQSKTVDATCRRRYNAARPSSSPANIDWSNSLSEASVCDFIPECV